MYSASTRAVSAAVFRLGRSASFTPGSRTRAIRKPGMVYGRVGLGLGMTGSTKDGAGAALPPPPPRPSGRCLDLAVLLEDPRLHELDRLAGGVDRPEVVEVPPLVPRPERPRGERDVDLALGAPPQAEAHQLGPRQRTVVEDDLGLGDQPLRAVLARHELHLHRLAPCHRFFLRALLDGRGAFGLAVRGVPRKRLPSTSPRLAETPGGRRRDSGKTAEGPPHIRRDDGAEATSRRASRSAAEGTPKGLARPRSDSAPRGARGRLRRRTVRPRPGRRKRLRDATTCARGEATDG